MDIADRFQTTLTPYAQGNKTVFTVFTTDLQILNLSDRIEKIAMQWQEGMQVAKVKNVAPGTRYSFSEGLIDPWAKLLDTTRSWGEPYQCEGVVGEIPPFDWEGVQKPRLPAEKMRIYEMHIRGFTKQDGQNAHPGTFLGAIERLDELQAMGINTLELLPIFEFDETFVHVPGCNYWGYSPLQFFYPCGRFAVGTQPQDPIQEFRQLVKEAHRRGMEVVLDVVFNHTGEGDESFGRFFSHRGLAESVYFLDNDYSGCGNSLNCNHPKVVEWIIAVMRHWAIEMQVDGFRFDLATVLTRGENGRILDNPPLIEAIKNDAELSQCKLIAEPWDAAGGYQVGQFHQFLEWNDRFRDDVRRFLRGDHGMISPFATRMMGSQDLYHGNKSINFITAHDGFTLWDLVSYNEKHNEANGENGQDGTFENYSWNCGIEGPTDDPQILELRERQWKNFWIALIAARGIPMILMGDERGASKGGNNNTWCHDGPINWLNWENGQDRVDWTKQLLTLPLDREGEVRWYGCDGSLHHFEPSARFVAWEIVGKMACAFNTSDHPLEWRLPDGSWQLGAASFEVSGIGETLTLPPRSSVLLTHV